jgi:UDP-3-O-[3-hydroxymyristoyl] glucosamine N-acyltransferase
MIPTSRNLAGIAEQVGATVQGDASVIITGVAPIEAGKPGCIGFLANRKYQSHLATTTLSAVIVTPAMAEGCTTPALIHPNPYATYARVAQLFDDSPRPVPGISEAAHIHPTAKIEKTASIGPGAVVAAGVVIGERSIVGANTVVGENSLIGDDCRIYPNVTIYHGVTMGHQVTIHSNSVIGADGFGFAPENGLWEKIPQMGGVSLGNNVEVGSSTTIDRGALNNTVLEDHVKIDNQVQIGHNARIGRATVIAGCSAIAGSATIGANCMLGGGTGVSGHLTICDGTIITGGTNILTSIRKPGSYSSGVQHDGTAAWMKNAARFKQLDKMARRITQLEKQLAKGGD